ncbi:MAG: chemotaxis protein CheW [Deltaproteobacteria bacterium]|nr:chemotaxis protein CheW [Deltaproteobacteria bacterium]
MSVDYEMKILLVEDSDTTLKMEVKILNQLGFNSIVEAEDGNAAIRKLGHHDDIRLIISDWNMPDMGGYDLLLWMRDQQRWKDLPFIMATAQAEKRQTRKAVEAGVNGFITKPFSPLELKGLIEEVFGEKPAEDPAESKSPRKASSGKLYLRVAHIQITDHLILGILKHRIAEKTVNPEHFELETQCMSSWNPVQRALETGTIDAAFVLAPIAMDLFSVGVPIKLVLFAHKNGSICIANRQGAESGSLQEFFKDKVFFLPHMLSVHHMLSTMFLRGLGLRPGVAGQMDVDVFFEVVAPIKMTEFLAEGPEASGYTVAEPLGTKAIASQIGHLMFHSGELWQNHPCCVVAVRDELIRQYPEAVQELVTMLVECGQFIAKYPDKAAYIAVEFLDPRKNLNLQVPVLKKVLSEPAGIKTDDLFPVIEDLERIQRYMVEHMGIGSLIDLERFVDTRFAQRACDKTHSRQRSSKMHNLSRVVSRIVKRLDKERETTSRKGGRHLIFGLGNQKYGIDIVSVKEIIGMMPIRSVPQTPPFMKGVINLRGKVIPVVDLRVKLGLEELDYTDQTCIIIAEIKEKHATAQVGVVVDSVSEVLSLKAEDIEEPLLLGLRSRAHVVAGIAKTDIGTWVLLDTNRLLGGQAVK